MEECQFQRRGSFCFRDVVPSSAAHAARSPAAAGEGRAFVSRVPRRLCQETQPAVPAGGGGIRTHGTVSRTAVFKTAALNHSATPPGAEPRRAFYGSRLMSSVIFKRSRRC